MTAAAAWTTLLAGGVYPAVWAPAGGLLIVAAALTRAPLASRRSVGLDAALLLVACSVALQLVPLPPQILDTIIPAAGHLRASLWPAPPAGSPLLAAWRPVSIVPGHTWEALGILMSAFAMFWLCRHVVEREGPGRVVRALAWIGLAASLAAIVQSGTARDRIYGFWPPADAGARPFGPFVNRNHFATWVLMVSPLVFGYVAARAPRRTGARAASQRVADALREIGTMRTWLVASVCTMTLALLLSTSRSGLIGLAGAGLAAAVLMTRSPRAPVRRRFGVQAALIFITALSFANVDRLMARFDESGNPWEPGRGRVAVWLDAARMAGDFALTGTGSGTFGTAVAPYQRSEPGYAIGQAHNHYLQVAAEGGLLVGAPAMLAVLLLVRTGRGLLTRRADPDYLIRAGAAAGLAGGALQSVWETGLRMPANAMIFAMLAAIVTHAPDDRARRGEA